MIRLEAFLRSEISNGHYDPVNVKRDICTPLAAINKSEGCITDS